jgi:hypothetical protein
MQTIPSQNEENERTDTQNSIPLPPPPTSSSEDVDTEEQSLDHQHHLSPVFNENNKRPRVDSPVVAAASTISPSFSPPALGPVVNPSTPPTSLPPAVIEGSKPKRAMSEEHLSSRGESPFVNVTSGQSSTSAAPAAVGNTTKLSEVVYPTDSTETVDAEMTDVAAPAQNEVKQETAESAPAQPVINKGMKPSERPSLQDQVTAVRGKGQPVCAIWRI